LTRGYIITIATATTTTTNITEITINDNSIDEASKKDLQKKN